MIKYGGQPLYKEITTLMQHIFRHAKIPEEWKTSIIIPMFKKGDKQLPDNYRGINLLDSCLKLTTKIITNKLTEIITLQDEQQGFRKNRSCTDAIFIIRQLSEKAL